MLFHEVYGCYYQAVARILSEAVKGNLDSEKMEQIVRDSAFSESVLEIIPALKKGRWQLLAPDWNAPHPASGQTPLRHEPTLPLTVLEKRWLKAVMLDKRMKLFSAELPESEDVKPLFTPEDYEIFDCYLDGDPYGEPHYIEVFRTLLLAVHEQKKVKLEYHSAKGTCRRITCSPCELEYSEKDDKFRVRVSGCRFGSVFNVANIEACDIIGEAGRKKMDSDVYSSEKLVLELHDERNALERILLHFAHLKKEAERLSDCRYRITLYYDKNDETEMVIRILSFGPMVKVIEPESFVNLIKKRLWKQKSCGLR